MQFEPWTGKIPMDLWNEYNAAYGAVMHGVAWGGSVDSITGVTKDEALEYATDFLKAMAAWLQAPSENLWVSLTDGAADG